MDTRIKAVTLAMNSSVLEATIEFVDWCYP